MPDLPPIGLVPAAGSGLRLGLPYPKELYPIIRDGRYKPVAQHVVENMVTAGIEHIVFVINETKHQLIGFFGDGRRFDCRISYVYQDRERRGTGGSAGLAEALDSAHHLLGDQRVVFGMADTIMSPENCLQPLVDDRDSDVHMGLFPTETPELVGVVERADDGTVRRIVDKQPDSGLRDMWGVIAWGPRFTQHLHARVADSAAPDFATILNEAVDGDLSVRATVLPGASYTDVGTWEEIEKLEQRQR